MLHVTCNQAGAACPSNLNVLMDELTAAGPPTLAHFGAFAQHVDSTVSRCAARAPASALWMSYFLSPPSHFFLVCAQGLVMRMYAEMRESHAEVLRAVRAQHGPGNGQVVPKNEDYKNVAKIWFKHAVNQRLMKSGIYRVLVTDPEHVNVLDVMDEHPIDLAR